MRPALLLLCACLAASAQAPYERILNSASQPENWLTYSGNYQGHRFSRLRQLTPENVSRLQVKWVYQFRNPRTEVSPLVVDGVMYLTAPQFAAAVDARTGRNLWTWARWTITSSPWTPNPAPSAGTPKWRITGWGIASRWRRWPSGGRCSSGSAGARPGFGASWTPTRPGREGACGVSGPSRGRANRGTRPGAGTTGKPEAGPPG